MSDVHYWETMKGSSTEHSHTDICFARINHKERGYRENHTGVLKLVRYHGYPPNGCKELTTSERRHWVTFLREVLLITHPWTARLTKRGVMYRLPIPAKMTWPQCLLYLTAFRYVSEHREAPQEFYARRKEARTKAERFELFQSIHRGKIKYCDGHGLISPGYGSSDNGIQYPTYLRRLKSKTTGNVNAHF